MKKELNKPDIIALIAERTMMPKKEIALVLDTFVDVVKSALKEGAKVKLVGFGNFEMVKRKGKVVKAPNGETIEIPDRITPKFTLSKKFIDALKREA